MLRATCNTVTNKKSELIRRATASF